MRQAARIGALLDGTPGLALLVLAWWAIHGVWGPFVLPSPVATARAFADMAVSGLLWRAAAHTAAGALGGFLTGVAIGAVLGLGAGLSHRAARALEPAVTIILGVPPIAWVVLSLLWFGGGPLGPVMTTALTTFPIVFAGMVQGVRTLDPHLAEMAQSFGADTRTMLWEVRLPHAVSYLLPAVATAHGIAWKATVMAEVMGSGRGLGGELATARINLDLPAAMALIIAAVILLTVIDAVVLDPLRRRVERWRRGGA